MVTLYKNLNSFTSGSDLVWWRKLNEEFETAPTRPSFSFADLLEAKTDT